jgi:hypothetical protein
MQGRPRLRARPRRGRDRGRRSRGSGSVLVQFSGCLPCGAGRKATPLGSVVGFALAFVTSVALAAPAQGSKDLRIGPTFVGVNNGIIGLVQVEPGASSSTSPVALLRVGHPSL